MKLCKECRHAEHCKTLHNDHTPLRTCGNLEWHCFDGLTCLLKSVLTGESYFYGPCNLPDQNIMVLNHSVVPSSFKSGETCLSLGQEKWVCVLKKQLNYYHTRTENGPVESELQQTKENTGVKNCLPEVG